MFIKARDETIATMQPYRPQEKWETTFMCQKDQFVKLKFESIDFTRIANDILKIQFYTHDMSKLVQTLIVQKLIPIRELKLFKTYILLRTTILLRFEIHYSLSQTIQMARYFLSSHASYF